MLGSGTEPKYGGWGTGAGTAAVADTGLFTAATEARVAGTSSRVTAPGSSVTNDAYQVVVSIVADAAKTITNFGLWDAAGTGSPPTGGNLHLHSSFDGIPLGAAGEGISFTAIHRFN